MTRRRLPQTPREVEAITVKALPGPVLIIITIIITRIISLRLSPYLSDILENEEIIAKRISYVPSPKLDFAPTQVSITPWRLAAPFAKTKQKRGVGPLPDVQYISVLSTQNRPPCVIAVFIYERRHHDLDVKPFYSLFVSHLLKQNS